MRSHDEELRRLALGDERVAGVALDELLLDLDSGLRTERLRDGLERTLVRRLALRAELAGEIARGHREHPRIADRLRGDERPGVDGDERREAQARLVGGPAERLLRGVRPVDADDDRLAHVGYSATIRLRRVG